MVDVKSSGSSDFDFMGEDEKTKVAGKKPETATSGNLGHLDLATVLEARKRAARPGGMDIAAFMAEFKLVTMDVDSVLNGPLPKE